MSYQAAAERLGCLIGRTRWGHPLSGNKEMWMAPFVALGVDLPSGAPFRCKHRIEHRKRARGERGLRVAPTCSAATCTETKSRGITEHALEMRISCFVTVANVRRGNVIAY